MAKTAVKGKQKEQAQTGGPVFIAPKCVHCHCPTWTKVEEGLCVVCRSKGITAPAKEEAVEGD